MSSIKFKITKTGKGKVPLKLIAFAVSMALFNNLLIASVSQQFVSANVFGIGEVSGDGAFGGIGDEKILPTSSDLVVTVEEPSNDSAVRGNFLHAGNEYKDIEVLKLKISSSDKTFRLKNLKIKISGVKEGYVSKVYFVDNEGDKHRASLAKGYAEFDNSYLKIGDETLTFFADFKKTFQFGQRFRFEIEKSEDLSFTLYGSDIYSDASYPLGGEYFSIVGDKIAF